MPKEGEIRVIAYASRTLSCAERNYSTTRRELLAVIFGFKQFRQFLLGRHFLLRVDHSALTYLRKSTDLIGQSARWLEFIEEYDFRIVHRSGGSHGNCDSMSRRPPAVAENSESHCCVVQRSTTPITDDDLQQWPAVTAFGDGLQSRPAAVDCEAACDSLRRPVQTAGGVSGDSVTDDEANATAQNGMTRLVSRGTKRAENNDLPISSENAASVELTPESIAAAQAQDPSLQTLLNVISDGRQRPRWSEIQSHPEETRILWGQYDSLCLREGVLYRQFYRRDGSVEYLQIVMPTALRRAFLQSIHCSGVNTATTHLGVRKTQAHVQQRSYWPYWRSDTETFCRRCPICQTIQHGAAPRHGKMQAYEANGAGDRLHIDLTGPHPTSRQGHIYILTAIDAYTRYLTAVPLRNKTAVVVADAIIKHVFLPFGAFRSIVSDQGKEFCCKILEEVTRLLDIEKLRTTSYRASSNGRIERVHRTLNELLSKVISENQRDWAERLPMVVAAYNAAQHETTQFSPYFLMYGREYRTPLDLTLDIPTKTSPESECEYVTQLRERIQSAYTAVNRHLHTTTQRMKIRYNAKVRDVQLEPGEFVIYYCPRRKVGRYQKWRRLCSICRVEARFNDVLYSIRTSPRALPIIAHVDRLRRYEGDVPENWSSTFNSTLRSAGPAVCNDGPRQWTATASRDNDPQQRPVTTACDDGLQQRPVTLAASAPHSTVSNSRPKRERRQPARFRRIIGISTENGQDSMEAATKRRKRGPRSAEAAERRRQRDKGPWPCPLCDHPVMGNISTLRRHVIGTHNRYCSWSGQMRPFDDEQEAARIQRVVSRPRSSRRTQHLSLDENAAPRLRSLCSGLADDTATTSTEGATEGHIRVAERDKSVQSAAAADASDSLTDNVF